MTSRTCGDRTSSDGRKLREHPRHRRQLHGHLQRAPRHRRPREDDREPLEVRCGRRTPTSAPIIARFQTTGAAYDRKNLWWLFRIPRHHAEITSSPAPGNRIRTTWTASARFSPSNPGAIRSMSHGAARTPASTMIETVSDSRPATAPATRSASSWSPEAWTFAYTGMNDPDRAPSPNRFWRRFGILKPALKASAASDVEAEVVREDADPDQAEDPADEDPDGDQHRSGSARARGGVVHAQ